MQKSIQMPRLMTLISIITKLIAAPLSLVLLAGWLTLWTAHSAKAQVPDSLVKHAIMKIDELDLADARALLDKALAQDPNHVEANYQLGMVNYYSSKFYGALQCFNKVISLDKNYLNAHIYRGDVLAMFNESDSALLSYKRALHINPKNDKVHLKLGVYYSSSGDYEQSVEQFNKAVELNPNNEIAFYLRGNLYLKYGKPSLACADLQTAASMGFVDAEELYKAECEGKSLIDKPISGGGTAKPNNGGKGPTDPKEPVKPQTKNDENPN